MSLIRKLALEVGPLLVFFISNAKFGILTDQADAGQPAVRRCADLWLFDPPQLPATGARQCLFADRAGMAHPDRPLGGVLCGAGGAERSGLALGADR
mgnify:CR=1 FL=1